MKIIKRFYDIVFYKNGIEEMKPFRNKASAYVEYKGMINEKSYDYILLRRIDIDENLNNETITILEEYRKEDV